MMIKYIATLITYLIDFNLFPTDKTYPLNRNHFYNNKYVLTEQKNVKTETKRKPYQQSDIHEDLEDGDDDGDEEEFNIDHGSGFGVF